MDVVIPLSSGSIWQDNELRFALRSLAKYAEDLGKVIVVGHKPEWLNADTVLHLPGTDARRAPKDANMIRKVATACEHVDGPFIRMSDDQFLCRRTTLAELPAYGRRRNDIGERPDGKWRRRKHRTQVWLQEHGYTVHDFDMHCPMPYEPEKFGQMMAEAPWQPRPGLCINTLYGNMAGLDPAPVGRELAYWRNGAATTCHRTILRHVMATKPLFGSYRNGALTGPLRYVLAVMFPDQSQFETSDHNASIDPTQLLKEGRRRKSEASRQTPEPRPRANPVRAARRRRNHAQLLAMGPEARRALREGRL